jgi:hypothetical protein
MQCLRMDVAEYILGLLIISLFIILGYFAYKEWKFFDKRKKEYLETLKNFNSFIDQVREDHNLQNSQPSSKEREKKS